MIDHLFAIHLIGGVVTNEVPKLAEQPSHCAIASAAPPLLVQEPAPAATLRASELTTILELQRTVSMTINDIKEAIGHE